MHIHSAIHVMILLFDASKGHIFNDIDNKNGAK